MSCCYMYKLTLVSGAKGGAIVRGVEIKGKGAEFIDKLNAEWNTIAAGNRMFCI